MKTPREDIKSRLRFGFVGIATLLLWASSELFRPSMDLDTNWAGFAGWIFILLIPGALLAIIASRLHKHFVGSACRELLEASPALQMLIRVHDGVIVEVSKGLLDLLGYSRDSIFSAGTGNSKVSVNPEHFLQILNDVHAGKEVLPANTALRKSDGSVLRLPLSVQPIVVAGSSHALVTFFGVEDSEPKQESLHLSDEHFRIAFEKGPLAMVLTNNALRFTKVNAAFCKMLGYNEEELLRMTVRDITHPDHIVHDLEAVNQVIAGTRNSYSTEKRYVRKDGTIVWGQLTIGRVLDDDGSFLHILAMVNDITERKRAENELVVSRAKLIAALESMTDAVFISDQSGRLIEFNDASVSFHRFGSRDECARTLQECHTLLDAFLIDGSPVPLDQWPVPRALRGEIVSHAEYMLRRRDTGETWIGSYSYAPIRNPAGSIVGAVVVGRDITERKQAEEELRFRNALLSTQIETSVDGILVVDKSSKIVTFNRRFVDMWGLSLELVEKKDDRPVLAHVESMVVNPQDFRERVHQLYEHQAESSHDEIHLIDGRVFARYTAPMIGAEHQYYGRIWYFRDVTETKRLQSLETRAQRLETASQVAGQIAHDFNNMLAPMVAYPEMLRELLHPDETGMELLNAIEQSAAQMAEINQQLLTLSRRGHYNQEALDLNVPISQAIRDLQALPADVVLVTALASDLMPIKGGASQLHRAVANLLINACDATNGSGRIVVKTENCYLDNIAIRYGRIPCGEYVLLTVSDDGMGMTEDVIQRIFDPFFTTKSADRKRGSGLGLSAVDAVVKDHNGYIDVETCPGGGTKFYLYFPITRESLSSIADCPIVGGSESILVVDDDQLQRQVVSRILSAFGYKVTTCESGEQALKLLGATRFDLVILDMIMPGGIDGTDTFKGALEIRPDQKAIIVSGFSESDRVTEALRLGAGKFVKKPLERRAIGAAVRETIDNRFVAANV